MRPEWGDRGGRDDEDREGDQRHVVAYDVSLSCGPSRYMVSTEPKSSTDNQVDKASRYTDESNRWIQADNFTDYLAQASVSNQLV